ncbi:nucleotide disphospho-sugar-binding domain-containing protein [Marinobacterium sedimentorum]|uniref:nucleotide disphospho-sugar-binding domain-containing protein n=1 Tax=Marinobacterium sedimentorum TaxID=2927804 RepID=UPI0020C678BA|nr:glycosyltransferase [Marinobacterium sedimentorum]
MTERANTHRFQDILLVTIGTLGDVLPFLVIGRRLQQQGLNVTIATHEHYRGKAVAYGLAFEPIAETDLQQFTAHEHAWHPELGVSVAVDKLLLPMIEPVFELTQRLALGRNVLTLAHPHALGARIAQDLHKFPLWTLYPSAWLFQSVHARQAYPRVRMSSPDAHGHTPLRHRLLDWLADRVLGKAELKPGILIGRKRPLWERRFGRSLFKRVSDDMLAKPVNNLRQRVGLPKIEGVLTTWCHSPQKAVGLFPSWYAEPQIDWPKHHLLSGFVEARSSAPLPEDLQAFLNDGDAPIVFTFGSEKLDNQAAFEAAASACRSLGMRAVFISADDEDVPTEQRGDIFFVRFAPFDALFQHVSCVVHHGGMGTASAALRAGIPQLLVPYSYDQPDNAVRLRGLGVGTTLAPGLFDREHLVAHIRALINCETVQENCRRYAQCIRNDNALEIITREISTALRPQNWK